MSVDGLRHNERRDTHAENGCSHGRCRRRQLHDIGHWRQIGRCRQQRRDLRLGVARERSHFAALIVEVTDAAMRARTSAGKACGAAPR